MLGFYLILSVKQVRAALTTNLSVFRPTNIVGKQRSWPLHLQTPAVCYKHVHMDVTSRMCSTSCKGLASACRLEWHACLQFDATLVLASQQLHHAHVHMTSPTILFLHSQCRFHKIAMLHCEQDMYNTSAGQTS